MHSLIFLSNHHATFASEKKFIYLKMNRQTLIFFYIFIFCPTIQLHYRSVLYFLTLKGAEAFLS